MVKNNEAGITISQIKTGKINRLLSTPTKAFLLICVPTQKRPNSKKTELNCLNWEESIGNWNEEPIKIAKIKPITNNGNFGLLSVLFINERMITNGIIHNVRPSFNVAATSRDSAP